MFKLTPKLAISRGLPLNQPNAQFIFTSSLKRHNPSSKLQNYSVLSTLPVSSLNNSLSSNNNNSHSHDHYSSHSSSFKFSSLSQPSINPALLSTSVDDDSIESYLLQRERTASKVHALDTKRALESKPITRNEAKRVYTTHTHTRTLTARRAFSASTPKKTSPPETPSSPNIKPRTLGSFDEPSITPYRPPLKPTPVPPLPSPPLTLATVVKTSQRTFLPNIEKIDYAKQLTTQMLTSIKKTTISVSKTVSSFLQMLPGTILYYILHPKEFKLKIADLKKHAIDEAKHYWLGTKLLYAEIQTAKTILLRTLSGSALTRRERKQLLRTTTDLFRVVPLSMFILIPFMELLLPVALKIFPNLLPSTFQSSFAAEDVMKRDLKLRVNMAGFFQETLSELAKEKKKMAQESARTRHAKMLKEKADKLSLEPLTIVDAEGNSIPNPALSTGTSSVTSTDSSKLETLVEDSPDVQSASELLSFLEAARSGDPLPSAVVIKFASLFQDDLTLDNMSRMQLVNMCKYMNIPPYGSDSFLRFQLRFKVRALKEDDQRILWEGITSLSEMELREACQERGMRSTGLTVEGYRAALQQWMELSVSKNIPISLLIMSRTFFLKEESSADDKKSISGLADAISGLDAEVVNQVLLEVATPSEKSSNPEILKAKMESLQNTNEKIKEEYEARKKAEEKKAAEAKVVKAAADEKKAAEKKAAEEVAAAAAAWEEKTFGDAEAMKTVKDDSDAAGKEIAETKVTADAKSEVANVESPLAVKKELADAGIDAISSAIKQVREVEAAKADEARSAATEGLKQGSDAALKAHADVEARAAAAATANERMAKEAEEKRSKDREEAAVKEAEEKKAKKAEVEAEEEEEEDRELSSTEIDALEQLVSKDPVITERTEIERIKLAMADAEKEELAELAIVLAAKEAKVAAKEEKKKLKAAEEEAKKFAEGVPAADAAAKPFDDKFASVIVQELETSAIAEQAALDGQVKKVMQSEKAEEKVMLNADADAKASVEAAEKEAAGKDTGEMIKVKESEAAEAAAAAAATKAEESDDEEQEEEEYSSRETKSLDNSIAALKLKISSMLSGLEAQVTTIEAAVGDKLHMLDKDNDGILSADELKQVLQHVLKREMKDKEAEDIVEQLDTDKDGVFTVQELMQWIEMNRFVRAVQEDRDVPTKAPAVQGPATAAPMPLTATEDHPELTKFEEDMNSMSEEERKAILGMRENVESKIAAWNKEDKAAKEKKVEDEMVKEKKEKEEMEGAEKKE